MKTLPHIPILPIVLFLLVLALFIFQRQTKTRNFQFAKDISSPTPSLSPSPSTIQPLAMVKSSPAAPSSKNTGGVSIQDLQYPNAMVTSQTSNSLTLESKDNAKNITDWYKERITALRFNAKSFVSTNTNGHILNKLVSSNGTQEVRVDITQGSGDQSVKISVNLVNT